MIMASQFDLGVQLSGTMTGDTLRVKPLQHSIQQGEVTKMVSPFFERQHAFFFGRIIEMTWFKLLTLGFAY